MKTDSHSCGAVFSSFAEKSDVCVIAVSKFAENVTSATEIFSKFS
jgi:hypothetical protein